MEKYIINQNMDCIRTAKFCTPISLCGCQIMAVDREAFNVESLQAYEDVAAIGLKKHSVELGMYHDEQQARKVFLALIDWLNEPNGKPVFVFPEYDEKDLVPWA